MSQGGKGSGKVRWQRAQSAPESSYCLITSKWVFYTGTLVSNSKGTLLKTVSPQLIPPRVMNPTPPTSDPALGRRLTNIRHILLVLSGKGGVGKSSVSVQIALSLLHSRPNARIGLLDIDLTGPSIPRMLGLQGRSVLQSHDGWIPVQVDLAADASSSSNQETASKGILKCMSIGFLLKDPKDSVVWRGPKKNAMIRQFLVDVQWGDLDWLIVDTPPGRWPFTTPPHLVENASSPSSTSHAG